MGNLLPRDVLLFAGGDALAKYGTLVRRTWPADRGGEQGKEVFTRTGSAWAVGRNGLLVPHGANVPRVEWAVDPVTGLLQPYWLLEAAGTNSLLQSQDLTAAAYTKVRTSATADVTTAPDGTTTADKLIEDASAAATHYVTQAVTITANEFLAVSRFYRAAERTRLRLQVADAGSTNGFRADFNFGTGQITVAANAFGSGTASGAAIVALANGWYRVSLWGALGGAITGAVLFELLEDGTGNPTYNGDGTSGLYVWGGQFERNGIAAALPPTSYVATTAGAVTRNADSCTIPWYIGPREMWAYLRFIERGGAYVTQGTARLFGTDAGSDAVRFMFYNSTIGRWQFAYADGSAFSGAVMTQDAPIGSVIELLGLIGVNGAASLRWSINGGAEQLAGPGPVATFPAQFDHKALGLGVSPTGNGQAHEAFSRALVGTGAGSAVATLADARQVIP